MRRRVEVTVTDARWGAEVGGNATGKHAEGEADSGVKEKLDRLDKFQQEHKQIAIPVAVLRKFSEDKSTNLASMIAFWAFFSIFPLFMVLITLLGFFLPADMKGQVLSKVGQMLPLLD